MTHAERLERQELLYFPTCPFTLPEGDDREFLRSQEVGRFSHKNISYDPATDAVGGARFSTPGHEERLRDLLGAFSREATTWVRGLLPEYATVDPDRASLRPEEEAVRSLRLTARNDLLHVDVFPTRPSGGRRLLRLFVNVGPVDPRVWVTSEPFDALLQRFGERLCLPRLTRAEWRAPLPAWRRLWSGDWHERPAYDAFLLRLHHAMKRDDAFQERAARKFHHFPPGSAWLLFSDGVAHAVLRGRHALEHSFFVPVECLRNPDASPLHQLEAYAAGNARRAG
jgi:hypothetical protein